ncbi:hypothetical protein [Kribbella sp. NPDC051620]|uniref:hypothetical protein n=1 Tax=Kribbella sp. NPDC051620 TaxID=3364120 RepID=UPI003799EA3F
MIFQRPGEESHKTVSDTEVNEALETGDPDQDLQDVDKIEHDNGRRSPGPVDEPDRRPPRDEDVTPGTQGTPIEPPD